MKIQNHRLRAEQNDQPIQLLNSPNQGGTITPKYLVLHYSAGASAESTVNWFMNPAANASAHLVIGMEGSITQLVNFNKKAWHAGISRWNELVGMNNYSIGIELDNPGKMRHVGGRWISWFGREYPGTVIMEATHKHQVTPAGWHIFSEAQIESCIAVSQLLVAEYGLLDVLGHDDIAPFRKEDPGPAFPMESFRARVVGRTGDAADTFKVNTEGSNLRSGAGMSYPVIARLKKGTKVEFINNKMNWDYILVVSTTSRNREREGWIHNSLLTRV